MKMHLPQIRGVIRRRLLVNFRVDPEVVQRQLPRSFLPKLHEGFAIAGVCLIRLEDIRPAGFPVVLGLSSENAAHRIAVVWDDANGPKEGVYIPRRDSGSVINRIAGGRLFPGEHGAARFKVDDTGDRVSLEMASVDGQVRVEVMGRTVAELPAGSKFRSVAEASSFFEAGSVGYSTTRAGDRLDSVVLQTDSWKVEPLEIEHVYSSYFADRSLFPEDSAEFDCALVMRDIRYRWRAGDRMYV
jgi:hypothetical protein